jgi:hypothetical protein
MEVPSYHDAAVRDEANDEPTCGVMMAGRADDGDGCRRSKGLLTGAEAFVVVADNNLSDLSHFWVLLQEKGVDGAALEVIL